MFSVILLHSLLILSGCSEIDDKVLRNLLRLCPEQYVSNDNGTVVNHASETGSCCREYYDHSLERMFYSNTTNYLEKGQSCLYPVTHPDTSNPQARKSFYMITNAPADGCIISDNYTAEFTGDYNQPTCNDSKVIPLRRFLPVFSKASGLIYKNPQCAFCHGQYEHTEWKSYASCFFLAPFEYDFDVCQVSFVYPGPDDDIQHLRCFIDNLNTCPDNFADNVNIPSTIDLSVNELAEACSKDELPRFDNDVYSKNVFCYICHNCNGLKRCSFTKCLDPPDDHAREGHLYKITRIFDWRVINQNMHVRHHETICGLESNIQICHEVKCPKGQLMTGDGEDKTCQMDSIRWDSIRIKFVMLLLLDFDHNMTVNDAALERILTQGQVENPWQTSWDILTFHRPFARKIDKEFAERENKNTSSVQIDDFFSHAYVQMSYKQKRVNPATFVKTIEHTLRKTWSFKIYNRWYRARQSFSKSTLVESIINVDEHAGTFGGSYGMPSWHNIHEVHSHERILYKAVVSGDLSPTFSIGVTRLMFCRQVELDSTHFEVFSFEKSPVALFYNRTGKFLFDNEFSKVDSSFNDPKYRICISDTGIELASNCRGKGTNIYRLFVVVFCILFV